MEKSISDSVSSEHAHGEHHELGFIRKYIFSTDHKVIGLQYGITSLCFLLFGFCLMMLMRWQLAFPGQPLPLIGKFLENSAGMPSGIMLPEFYNSLGYRPPTPETKERANAARFRSAQPTGSRSKTNFGTGTLNWGRSLFKGRTSSRHGSESVRFREYTQWELAFSAG